MKVSEEKVKEILERGVEEVIEKSHLESVLGSGKKLVVKFGIDPTSPDLHLGHMVPLRKLKQFQSAGHTIALIIGDFTATIGDPSGRSEERKPLSLEEVKKNLKKYLGLANKILNIKKCKIFYNSSWFKKAGMEKVIELSRASSLQQTLRRADFQERMKLGNDISMLELWYPLFQGYDSVMVKADVEIGGTDQKFNLLMGRRVQRHFGKLEQDIMTLPLIEGTDGTKKMSKSAGNYIALDESSENIYSKIISIPDELVKKYFFLLTDINEKDKIFSNPVFEQKKRLAKEIISFLHSSQKALSAGDLQIVTAKNGEQWIDFLTRNKFVKSNSEAKRLVEGGGVDFCGIKIQNHKDIISKNGDAKIGKHKSITIKIK